MNRNFANGGKLFAMHVQMVMVNAKIGIGTTGAVGTVAAPLVSSVTRVSTGIYRLNFPTTNGTFNQLLTAHGSMHSPVSGLSGISTIEIQNAPSTSVATVGAPTLTIKTLNPAGALADPASGSTIDIMAIMSNSSVNVQSSPVAAE